MTPFDRAQRYVGQVLEIPGDQDHPLIQWWLSLCGMGFSQHDETPWCSAFANGVAWDERLARSKSARARSWLTVGVSVPLPAARPGYDLVVLKRGGEGQPGPEVLEAPGHVGFFAGFEGDKVLVLGGNQGNQVSIAYFPKASILGIRSIKPLV